MLPHQITAFTQSVFALSLWSSNILFWYQGGYFEAPAAEKPLLHTWSLAVEMQFYILLPILLSLLWHPKTNRSMITIIAITFTSLLFSEWGSRHIQIANFYLLPTRAWELLAGTICAFVLHKNGCNKDDYLAMLGLATVTVSIFTFDENTPFPSLYSLIPISGVVLIILYAEHETLVAKILSQKILVGIGLISYSLYLWHQPLFVFFRIRQYTEPTISSKFILIAISLLFAYLTWRYIENPLRSKDNFPRKVFLFIGLIFIAFSSILLIISPFFAEKIYSHKENEILKFSTNYKNRSEVDYWNSIDKCFLIGKSFEDFEHRKCFFPKFEDPAPTILLVGDSHSGYLGEGLLPFLEEKRMNLLQLSISHCASLSYSINERCNKTLDKIRELVEGQQVDAVVEFHTMNMETYAKNPDRYSLDYQRNLKFIANHVEQVFVIGQIPIYHPSLPAVIVKNKDLHARRLPISLVDKQSKLAEIHLRNLISELDLPNVVYVSLFDHLCDTNSCLVRTYTTAIDNILVWDYGHLSESGAVYLSNGLIGEQILQALNLKD